MVIGRERQEMTASPVQPGKTSSMAVAAMIRSADLQATTILMAEEAMTALMEEQAKTASTAGTAMIRLSMMQPTC